MASVTTGPPTSCRSTGGRCAPGPRVVAGTVWQTFRGPSVVEYEIPKCDGDLGRPNLFIDIDAAGLQRKIDLLEGIVPVAARTHLVGWRDRPWTGPPAGDRGSDAVRGGLLLSQGGGVLSDAWSEPDRLE